MTGSAPPNTGSDRQLPVLALTGLLLVSLASVASTQQIAFECSVSERVEATLAQSEYDSPRWGRPRPVRGVLPLRRRTLLAEFGLPCAQYANAEYPTETEQTYHE